MFAGFDYWIGKMSGHQYPESLGRLHFWITFVGVNLIFMPMHFSVRGRIPDYPELQTTPTWLMSTPSLFLIPSSNWSAYDSFDHSEKIPPSSSKSGKGQITFKKK